MKKKYSNCNCGETAFDGKYNPVLENDKVEIRLQYRCRNCMRLLNTKANESTSDIYNYNQPS